MLNSFQHPGCEGMEPSPFGVLMFRHFNAETEAVIVLDGELAVPCNPQSAVAGLNLMFRHFNAETQAVIVLDGELAVPCNPQSAIAGLNSCPRSVRLGMCPGKWR